MKILTSTFIASFLLTAFNAVVDASLCDDCNLRCSSWNVYCKGKRQACVTSGTLFRKWMDVVNGACRYSGLGSADARRINDAKNLLVARGVFSRAQLDRVDMRFCFAISNTVNISLFGKTHTIKAGAGAITTSSRRIYFDDSRRTRSTKSLAELMAHEMRHTQQYTRWGYNGFSCRYSGQIVRFNGTGGDKNYIESEAYTFSRSVGTCLRAGRSRCP